MSRWVELKETDRNRHGTGPCDCSGTRTTSILTAQKALLALIAERFRQLASEDKLSTTFDALCASFVHLHLNRVAGLDHASEQRILSLLLRTRDSLQKAPLRQANH
jgi:lantibiotic biosynthesis protein